MRYTKLLGIVTACVVPVSLVCAQTKTGGGGSHQSSSTTGQTSGSAGQKGSTTTIAPINLASALQPDTSPGPGATTSALPNNDPLKGSSATGSPPPTTATTP